MPSPAVSSIGVHRAAVARAVLASPMLARHLIHSSIRIEKDRHPLRGNGLSVFPRVCSGSPCGNDSINWNIGYLARAVNVDVDVPLTVCRLPEVQSEFENAQICDVQKPDCARGHFTALRVSDRPNGLDMT